MRSWLLGLVLCLAACGSDREAFLVDAAGLDSASADAPLGLVDERTHIPAPDPRMLDIVTPEEIVQPGEEKMFCYHVQNTEAALAVRDITGAQGPGGHHIALLATSDPRPSGTVEDCTSPEANAPLRWFVISGGRLPDGYGISVPQGMDMVVQFHYINTGEYPILVRDYVRLERVDVATVTTWVSTLIMQDLAVSVPPGPSTLEWTCPVPDGLSLMMVFGHMHNMGQRFEADLGSADELHTLYTIDPWEASFRDNAPTMSFYAEPVPLPSGSVFRTRCDWTNTSPATITYPAEMCALFAYVAGSQTPLQCTP